MKIESFSGEYSFLSNFYMLDFVYKSVVMKSVEHGFQAMKTNNVDDFLKIINSSTPKLAKALGRNVILRGNWEETKESVMLSLLREKFSQSTVLKMRLLKTCELELIEGNVWHDNEWGNCICQRCREKTGANKLGMLLMKVRDEL